MKKNKKIVIVWISRFAPVSIDPSAGSKTFDYYFHNIVKDSIFDVKLISCGFYNYKSYIEKENEDVEHEIIYWNNPNTSFFSKFQNIESKFNLFNKHCNLIHNSEVNVIKKKLKYFDDKGIIPDVVILEWTNMVMLAKEIREIFPDTRIIASEHDVTFVGYLRKKDFFSGLKKLYWSIKYNEMHKKEIQQLRICDLILTQNIDYKTILESDGVESNKIKKLVPFYNDLTGCNRSNPEKNILFFGAMGRPENYLSALWFIENVLPEIEDETIKFVIVGNNPPDVLKEKENSRIIVTGYVETVIPYFEKAMCFVAPLVLGAGIKVKVLEALSSGVPVLTNEIGIEGIPAKNNEEFLLCKNNTDYVNYIKKLSSDEEELRSIGEAGRNFIINNFSISNSIEYYKDLIQELVDFSI